MRSNCILFAYALKRRRKKRGVEGYILRRDSRWGNFFHRLYGERRKNGLIRVVSYIPINPRHKKFPPPVFTGRVKWGDKE